ncbi:MAG: hypothetical protein JNM46_01410 [Anaerolineales bacterium]|nr:hypothetical protein [Anaerolineales bacterium]
MTLKIYYFLPFLAGDFTPRGAGFEGVVLFAEAGLEGRLRLEADGLADVAAVFLLVDVFNAVLRSDFESGSVLREAVAGVTLELEAGCGGGIFLAASCQFG